MTTRDTLEHLRGLLVRASEREPQAASAALDAEAQAALRQALRILSTRGYATEELRRRLLRTHAPEAVERTLQALAQTPFLDDGAWASAYVAGTRGRERSAALLRRELGGKGVASADIAAALEAHDDTAAALGAARRRVGALSRLESAVRARRLRDYLLRRGFSAGAVRRALEEVLVSSGG